MLEAYIVKGKGRAQPRLDTRPLPAAPRPPLPPASPIIERLGIFKAFAICNTRKQ